jgi:hypothetical protein
MRTVSETQGNNRLDLYLGWRDTFTYFLVLVQPVFNSTVVDVVVLSSEDHNMWEESFKVIFSSPRHWFLSSMTPTGTGNKKIISPINQINIRIYNTFVLQVITRADPISILHPKTRR